MVLIDHANLLFVTWSKISIFVFIPFTSEAKYDVHSRSITSPSPTLPFLVIHPSPMHTWCLVSFGNIRRFLPNSWSHMEQYIWVCCCVFMQWLDLQGEKIKLKIRIIMFKILIWLYNGFIIWWFSWSGLYDVSLLLTKQYQQCHAKNMHWELISFDPAFTSLSLT